MYRCISSLKGLLIDIDSFSDPITEWDCFRDSLKMVFMTSNEKYQKELKTRYGEESVLMIDSFSRYFVPNKISHIKTIKQMGINATELAYVSRDFQFIRKAMGFLSAAIWISDHIEYTEISTSADLICPSIKSLATYIDKNVKGYLGEIAICPTENNKVGVFRSVNFSETKGWIYVLGRYFGYSHYMNQLHPYSTAIYANKIGKAKGAFDDIFAKVFSIVVEELQRHVDIDGICAIPPRVGEISRFSGIVDKIAKDRNVANLNEFFVSNKNYLQQKGLSKEDRKRNIEGAFVFNGVLSGKKVVLIDDIMTTGATITVGTRALQKAGAEKVYVIVLAVNQLGSYWSSNEPVIRCPRCKGQMKLRVNSKDRSLFYTCLNNECNDTISYYKGYQQLIDIANRECIQERD